MSPKATVPLSGLAVMAGNAKRLKVAQRVRAALHPRGDMVHHGSRRIANRAPRAGAQYLSSELLPTVAIAPPGRAGARPRPGRLAVTFAAGGRGDDRAAVLGARGR